ncbi:hypothetical protein [Clostridium saccharoperbutylacetonicum]|uniref:hypothetical protein n=1 Tax=Clostridium saccharoperbutylacetonicum TaxID=36745 RepID=UPI001E15AB01|nr:hypothetical protein [Clostridium saccharoperbutylacetonicum]NSB30278.1 hypothetical protein [Clostridium saccharoperbutylacetonicum]
MPVVISTDIRLHALTGIFSAINAQGFGVTALFGPVIVKGVPTTEVVKPPSVLITIVAVTKSAAVKILFRMFSLKPVIVPLAGMTTEFRAKSIPEVPSPTKLPVTILC